MRRSLLAIVLLLSFLMPAASQATPLDPLWALFAALWKATALDEGCGMDPSGRCQPSPRLASDEGCGMDPNGRCNPAERLEAAAGCGMDPSGRCNPAR